MFLLCILIALIELMKIKSVCVCVCVCVCYSMIWMTGTNFVILIRFDDRDTTQKTVTPLFEQLG